MTWAKLDDRANEHRKQLAAGAEACWLWACGLMYANRQPARDGYIPEAVLPMLYPMAPRARLRLCARLVEVGLWVKVDGGYQVHQFTAWNKTKEQLESEREATRLRVAEHRRNKSGNGASNASGNAVTPIDVPDPYRSAPLPALPSPSESSARASGGSESPEPDEPRLTICPLDLREKAESLGILGDFVDKYHVDPEQIREAIREFTSYWTIGGGTGRTQANWPKKLREHLRKACERPGALKAPGAIEHQDRAVSPERRAELKRIADKSRAKFAGGAQ